jgi:hypothetical protein
MLQSHLLVQALVKAHLAELRQARLTRNLR